jgi:WD40 repeat protein/tRNA A-37 threonylcarbamoyl transferase component Bud32
LDEPDKIPQPLADDATSSRTFSASETPRPSAAPAEDSWRVPAEREGQYTRLEELGRGGQSVVRRARDEFIGREVAFKELLPALDASSVSGSAAWTRFLREARLTAQLDHPGIVAIHELGQRADGTLFCSQKLVRGETLKKKLQRCGSLDERLQLLPHLIDACRAVAYAHSCGVVHRDLKPSNIMVGPFGETVVVDWGLAKRRGESEDAVSAAAPAEPELSVYGAALGTPAYMSPEQARGALAEIDERSDVFSLGAILYELLTARAPFAGESVTQVIDEVRAGRFPRVLSISPEAPGELAAVSEHALAHAPADRYASAQALSQELSEFRAGGKVTAYRYGARELLRKFVAGHRTLAAAVAAALAVLLASSLAIGWQLHVARINLAQSLLLRARAAEQGSDWARAAGFYAASRIEHDSRESRWGYALARQRMPQRLYFRQGEPQSMLDVGFTASGRGLVLGLQDLFVVARDLSSGQEVWRYRLPAKPDYFTAADGQIMAIASGRRLYLDLEDGHLKAAFERSTGLPCNHGPLPPPVLRTAAGIVTNGGEEKPLVLSSGGDFKCTVSNDARQVAFQSQDGVVHVWDLIERKELVSSLIPDASEMVFTAHGLAVVGTRALHVFGGNEGSFTVAIPRSGGNGLMNLDGRQESVSPDGHLVVVGRLSANQADLVDLRRRTVVSSFSYAPGVHAFTFSPTGDKLIVSGLLHGSSLAAWDLRPLLPKLAAAGTRVMAFQSAQERGRFAVLLDPGYQVWNASGEKVLTVEVRERGNTTISADGRWLGISDSKGVGILEIETGKMLWQFPCASLCLRMRLSRDGSRMVTWNRNAVELWDVAQRRAIWRETQRQGSQTDALDLSEDGRGVIWTRGTSLFIHREGQASDEELKLEDAVSDAAFSRDGTRIAIISPSALELYERSPLRRLWKVSNASSVDQEVQWSADDSALIILNDSLGTSLLDSRTGARFANVAVTKPAAYSAQEVVLPDLRHRLSRGDGRWELWDLPPPDEGSPRASLQRVLDEAGLVLSGSELLDAEPNRSR